MYKVIIIDDETKIREVLKLKIAKLHPELKVIGEAANAAEAYTLVSREKPDLIFLDISMPGESGFDLLERFDKIDFEIIFATGYHEYALDALKVSAVDYILKPFRNTDICAAIEKAVERMNRKSQLYQYQLLKENLQTSDKQESTISIVNKDSYQLLKIHEIIRCEGWQKYTRIYTIKGDCIVSSYNLGYYSKMLENFDFYSCHKSHLINKNHVDSYLKEGFVVMKDDAKVPVSRRRKSDFIRDVLA